MCEILFHPFYQCTLAQWIFTTIVFLCSCGTLFLIWFLVYSTFFAKYLTEGKVIDKYIEPENSWTTLMPMIIGKITILMPMFFFDDKDWVLIVEKDGVQGTIYVSEYTYKHVRVGQYYKAKNSDLLEDDVNEAEVEE